jgi:hypothetical protein
MEKGLALTTEQRCTLGNNCTLCNNNWATLHSGQQQPGNAALGNNWATRFTGQLLGNALQWAT